MRLLRSVHTYIRLFSPPLRERRKRSFGVRFISISSVVPVFLVVFLVSLSPSLVSRGHVREPFIRIVRVALGLGLTTFAVHAFPLRLVNIPEQAEVINFVPWRPVAFPPLPRAIAEC